MLNLDAIEGKRNAVVSGASANRLLDMSVLVGTDLPALIIEDRDLRKKLEQSDAAAAAMRGLLNQLQGIAKDNAAFAEFQLQGDPEKEDRAIIEEAKTADEADVRAICKALDNNAGVALLERVRELEDSLRWCLERMPMTADRGRCQWCNPTKLASAGEFVIPGNRPAVPHTRDCKFNRACGVVGK